MLAIIMSDRRCAGDTTSSPRGALQRLKKSIAWAVGRSLLAQAVWRSTKHENQQERQNLDIPESASRKGMTALPGELLLLQGISRNGE